jgi:hypothetical protein
MTSTLNDIELRPEVIRLLGQNIYIRYLPEEGGMQELGLSHLQSQRIDIREGQQAYEERDTLLHETLHFCSHLMEADLDERQVTVITHALMAVFQDNQEFAQYITEKI